MSWRNIRLILMREVRDQLRDRRTLFMIAVLPLLLYPALGIGMVQMTLLFQEQPRTVVVLGNEELPAQPQLLEVDYSLGEPVTRFVANFFLLPGDAEKLDIVTETALPDTVRAAQPAARPVETTAAGDEAAAERLAARAARRSELLAAANRIRGIHEQRDVLIDRRRTVRRELNQLRIQLESDKNEQDGQTNSQFLRQQAALDEVDRNIALKTDELSRAFATSPLQVLIIVPEGFGKRLEEANSRLRQATERDLNERDADAAAGVDYPRPVLLHNNADKKSSIAYERVREVLSSWEEAVLNRRLAEAHLPESLNSPVNFETVDVAKAEQMSDSLWSILIPALLVIMSVTGAFYPAVDLAAGEKERGTMETLLICPATRTEIVLGKFFTVMLFSMSTALLNLASMGMTGRYMFTLGGGGALQKIGNLAPPSASAILWMVVLLIPLAALFSALCLALATFARSSKEGQYYLTPLLMVTLGLTVFCLSPAVEIMPFYSVMPVVGPALLLKELLASPGRLETFWYAIPVLITSIGYSLLALWWAIEQFCREDILFREAERFEVGLWLRHLLRDKLSTPSFAEGGFCFVIIMLLQFAAMGFMQDALRAAEGPAADTIMMKLLLIQQLAIIASPALIMGAMLTTSLVETFRIKLPDWRMLAVAAVLPFALHPLSVELLSRLEWFFPDLLPSFLKRLAEMTSTQQPLWFILLTFAVAPAICEELAYRGFILSGFARSGRIWLAIFLSSLTFGIMHMIPQQVFNATLLGMVLGLIAIRSGSLLPCIVFHMIFNSLQILRGQYGGELGRFDLFFALDAGQLRYQWPTLLIAGGVAILLLRWLVNHGQKDAAEEIGWLIDRKELGGPIQKRL